jgi:molybdopterin-guanine dinucleotide biosynthesis protein A/HD superfamily phosphodiesterase
MIPTDTTSIPAACLILAGGKGRRLTPDKPLLEVNGRSIIERTVDIVSPLFDAVLIVTNTPDQYAFLQLPTVSDETPDCGPLMGIYSGLRQVDHDIVFACAADMPFLNEAIIRSQFQEMGAYDIVVPRPWKRPEFLHAFYHRRCLPAIRRNLDAGLLKLELLAPCCPTRQLDAAWFAANGLSDRIERAFANVNTISDYHYWRRPDEQTAATDPAPTQSTGSAALNGIAPAVVGTIRRTLIDQETAFQTASTADHFSSIWAHSSRVARIAHHIAAAEGWEAEPALLAGLLHDSGKFAHGTYHPDDTPEEEHAVRVANRVLSGTPYEKWLPVISEAILSTYLEGSATNDIGRAVYDADCLDKLGAMGVVQFFAKKALRRKFLNDDVLIRTSIELTYAHHAPDTLMTRTGRALALTRRTRTRRFFSDLLDEWRELGMGDYAIVEEDIAGIVCILVVPTTCACGGPLKLMSDIEDALKCRSVIVQYGCPVCGSNRGFSFCLPRVSGLPAR